MAKTKTGRAKIRKQVERLFPISYNGKEYHAKDCDDIFLAFYHTRFALGFESSVYVGDGMRVCPDGKFIEQ